MGGSSSKPDVITFADNSTLQYSAFPHSAGRTCELGNGRVLGYEIYGAVDEATSTVLFFHGTPGSRLFFPPELAEKFKIAGIKVYAVERPGFGLSTPQPDRSLLSWAEKDIPAFADALGIDKFAVLGYSAGGPYALACAAKLNGRVTKALVVSTLCPPFAPGITSGMNLMNQVGWFLSKNWRSFIAFVVHSEAQGVLANPKKKVHEMITNAAAVDIAAYNDNSSIQRLFVESALEMYSRQNWTAEVEDYWIFGHDWGFELKEIAVPVYLWSGLVDQSTTAAMAKHIEQQIPGCNAKLVADKGHMLFFDLFDDFVTTLSS